jgi:hypothetical protein
MRVRALIDIMGSDIKSGEFFDCSEDVAAVLVADGQADDKALEADVYGESIPAAKALDGYDPNSEAPAAKSKKGKKD